MKWFLKMKDFRYAFGVIFLVTITKEESGEMK
jgi:hypothetical protein